MNRRCFGLVMLTLAVGLAACSQAPEADSSLTPQYGTPEADFSRDIVAGHSGVFVAAHLDGTEENTLNVVQHFNERGTLVWQRTVMDVVYDPPWNSIAGMAATPSREVIVAANFGPNLVKYSATGEEVWRRGVADPGFCDTVIFQFVSDVDVDSQGNYYVLNRYDGGGSSRCSPVLSTSTTLRATNYGSQSLMKKPGA